MTRRVALLTFLASASPFETSVTAATFPIVDLSAGGENGTVVFPEGVGLNLLQASVKKITHLPGDRVPDGALKQPAPETLSASAAVPDAASMNASSSTAGTMLKGAPDPEAVLTQVSAVVAWLSAPNTRAGPSFPGHPRVNALLKDLNGHALPALVVAGLLLASCCFTTAAFFDTWAAAGQSVDIVAQAEERAMGKRTLESQADLSRTLHGPGRSWSRMRPRQPTLAGLPTMKDAHVHFPLLLPLLLAMCGVIALVSHVMVGRRVEYWVSVWDAFAIYALSGRWEFTGCILLPFALHAAYLSLVGGVVITKLRAGARAAPMPASPHPTELLHVVVIPACKEPWAVLYRTIASVARQSTPNQRRCLLLAFEACDPHAQDVFARIRENFGADFGHVWCTLHVLQEGEEAGKAANENFAVRWLHKELAASHDPDCVMITICDADSDFPVHHLDQVEAAYFNEPSNDVVYAGALNTWGNYLDTWHPLIKAFEMKRVVARLQTMWLPMPPFHTKVESNYSLTLGLAHRIDYWTPDVMQEDTHTQHKVTLLLRNGVPVVPVYSMISNDLVTSFGERYCQAKRHGWAITQIAWVLTLYHRFEFKVFAHHLYEAVHRQFIMKLTACWWLAAFLPAVRHVFMAVSRQTQATMAGMLFGFMAIHWIFDTVLLGYVWYGLLARRSTVPKPSLCSFAAMRLLAWPLGFTADLVFQMLPLWHCALHALFSPHFEYVPAPKGVKSWASAKGSGAKDAPDSPLTLARPTGDCGRLSPSTWATAK